MLDTRPVKVRRHAHGSSIKEAEYVVYSATLYKVGLSENLLCLDDKWNVGLICDGSSCLSQC